METSNNTEPNFFLYLHGGAYINTAQPSHFDFLYDICSKTGATILLPCYPRPPTSKVTFREVLDVLVKLSERIRGDDSSGQGDIARKISKIGRYSLGGDSAGAGMALALCLLLSEKNMSNLLPRLLMLNAPWLDVSGSSTELQQYDKLVCRAPANDGQS